MQGQQNPISRDVARQAAHWMMLLHSGEADSQDHADCQKWRSARPENELAWQRVARVQERLGVLPPAVGMASFNRERRQGLKKLLICAALLPAGYLAYQSLPWNPWMADHRTAVGERRRIELADGSLLYLNTDSAVDLHFDDEQRLIQLHRGEILVTSGRDPGYPRHRPLRVQTAEGRVQALGTRFGVRQLPGQTQLAMFEGAVRVEPLEGKGRTLSASEQLRFRRDGFGAMSVANEQSIGWQRGQLIVESMQLAEFLAELDRYRPGLLRHDPQVADLRISGTFQLDNTDAILTALPATLPVTVSYRTRYWVHVAVRE
ncbi:FecR domain-containing protein [Stutzerimonas kirkiae]|uniref:FecR domain-containing protein n=1 Tax=Stutzerimonas kirkiae TaxID=2211392 RepID=UPI0010383B0C|nr:FecR domain-containing protein [Stutzerimonas kirkiae]TBV07526.1 iron dicitrate transport regulator FecR [Stutzerimonas kirkiae]